MPSTQAYSVDWDVEIAGKTVNRDVVEVTIKQKDGSPDSVTVKLDTSKDPHAIEQGATVRVTLDDRNTQVTFRGSADAVKDDQSDPVVTIDAREPRGNLDDVSAVAITDEETVFDVIDRVVDDSPGEIDGITFDAASLKSRYGTFGNSTIFGSFSAFSVPPGLGDPSQKEEFTTQEATSGQGKPAEITFDHYANNTTNRYQAELIGEDGNGDEVTAIFDIPPGDDAVDAYGTDTFKLPIQGGTGLFHTISGISTNLPDGSSESITLGGTVKNYVKTDFTFRADSDQSVRDAIDILVGYISTLDTGQDWGYHVTAPNTGTPELNVQPVSDGNSPDRYVFSEGDNVLRPVANRSLDGVYNMVKVNGQGTVTVWAWAYDGTFYFSFNNPFESGEYPDNPDFNTTYGSTGTVNDIDQINLRSRGISAPQADDVFQANDLAEEALRQLYRTPVSGVATVTGLHPADPGDEAEVYYPSRGIPAKVVDNVYTVKAVEYTLDTTEAQTKIDFGISEPTTNDMIQAANTGSFGTSIRNDLSSTLQQNLGGGGGGGSTAGRFPIVGTIDTANDDGTFTVVGEDGETYENVRVI